MDRSDDLLIPPETSWLIDPAAQRVCAVLLNAGYDIYFVGGCVRNALLGLPDSDIDLSTNALPHKVIALGQAAGLRAVPTGIDHGTVTLVVDGTPFEITTFRKDVETDGRRAVVSFSDDIAEDARRRDFTINALYATPEGCVVDPLGGLSDLNVRRIRFIEDPEARIREDYLRILRFFRFSAWYADPDQGFDADALAAIAANAKGLETLSAERIGQEMTKLLGAPDPAPAAAAMRQTGVLSTVLPGSEDRWLSVLVHLETTLALPQCWTTRLALLGGEDLSTRLRLSKADVKEVVQLREAAFSDTSLAELAYRMGAALAQQILLLRSALAENMPETAVLETISRASNAIFPITSKDLMDIYQGPALGARLRALEAAWIASDFTLSRDALMKLS